LDYAFRFPTNNYMSLVGLFILVLGLTVLTSSRLVFGNISGLLYWS